MSIKEVTYGLGGYCENCDDTHNHPLHNLVEVIDIPEIPQKPLDPVGVLATLLVVEGVIKIEDGANAVGLLPKNLIVEAQAWAL